MQRHLLYFLPLLACSAPDRGTVKIIGHGGAGAESPFPANSELSVAAAGAMRIDGIEVDVQLTADSVLVAYHAGDLDGMTGCSGKINARTWAELRPCPVVVDGVAYPIARVDSLVLAGGGARGSEFTLDCKLFAQGDWWAYLHAFANAIADLDKHRAAKSSIIVECQVTDFLDLVKDKRPGISTYLYAKQFGGAIDTALAHQYTGITIDNSLITGAQVAEARERGLAVTLFGAGTALGHREALGKQPDRLQTDAPGEFAR